MGNCIEKCECGREKEQLYDDEQQESVKKPSFLLPEVDGAGNNKEQTKGGMSMRIKIVLTKEELQLLLLELKNKDEAGKKRLEDVLDEIERSRRRSVVVSSWKPSLDSIVETESPEVPEQMDRGFTV